MANTQINITVNGKKTLKTAGKYCDRDIDIVTNVQGSGATPTQFTNVITHASTELRFNQTHDGATRNGELCVVVDLVALGITTQRKMEFRFRGLVIDLGYMNIKKSTDKISWSNLKSLDKPNIDSYGDCVVTISSLNPTTIPYLLFMFRNSTTEVTADNYAGAILTINEPIGNGGYVG